MQSVAIAARRCSSAVITHTSGLGKVVVPKSASTGGGAALVCLATGTLCYQQDRKIVGLQGCVAQEADTSMDMKHAEISEHSHWQLESGSNEAPKAIPRRRPMVWK